jgi:hypothetical protein
VVTVEGYNEINQSIIHKAAAFESALFEKNKPRKIAGIAINKSNPKLMIPPFKIIFR